MHNQAIEKPGWQPDVSETELEKQIQKPEMKKVLSVQRTFRMPVKYLEGRLGFILLGAGGIREEAGRLPKQAAGTLWPGALRQVPTIQLSCRHCYARKQCTASLSHYFSSPTRKFS